MLAGEPKPVRHLPRRQELLLLGHRHRESLALTEQTIDLLGHERRLTSSGGI
jgi:hypothetical protein